MRLIHMTKFRRLPIIAKESCEISTRLWQMQYTHALLISKYVLMQMRRLESKVPVFAHNHIQVHALCLAELKSPKQ